MLHIDVFRDFRTNGLGGGLDFGTCRCAVDGQARHTGGAGRPRRPGRAIARKPKSSLSALNIYPLFETPGNVGFGSLTSRGIISVAYAAGEHEQMLVSGPGTFLVTWK